MSNVNQKSASRSRVRIREGNELKLTKKMCRALGIEEGDLVNLTLVTDVEGLARGALILTPQGKQTGVWTDAEWKAKEREAGRSIRAGRTNGPFDDVETAIRFLKKHNNKSDKA